jgi:ABC-type bacteriocin/lantibiotic exporter with double-glycine peptidase domain
MLGQVAAHQQQSRYSCSAAALLAVLKHWGSTYDEPTLTKLIGAKPVFGATAAQVVEAAKRLGFNAEERKFKSIAELKELTDRDIPVMAAILSFMRLGQGHFVVATAVDDRYVQLMDPNSPTNWRLITHDEMMRRWRGRDSIGVIVTPRQAARAALGDAPSAFGGQAWLGAAVVAASLAGAGVAVWRGRNREDHADR